jgi:hypothetical protein
LVFIKKIDLSFIQLSMSILVKMMSMNTQTEQAKGKKLISLEGNSLLENTTDISTMEQAKGKKLISKGGQ